MTDVFMAALNMSVTAAFVIAVLCLARLALQKIHAPKWISYALWAVAGFRLAVPVAFESFLSLIPRNLPAVDAPPRQYYVALPPIGTPERMEYMFASSLPAGAPVWTVYDVLAVVWLVGVAGMLLYAAISYVRLIRRKDSVATPFVYGFVHPKIHIPDGLAGEELRCVTLHEQTHVKRHDHLVKLFAFALLCVHWFNPLAWVAFVLFCADMEMSCDERVLRELGTDAKADYSQTLLSLSMNRRIFNASPLAFGEGGLKERVKNVLNFKKRPRVIIVAAIALAVVLTVGFAANKPADNYDFKGFDVNGYALGSKIDTSKLTPAADKGIMYAHNYENISFDTDENGLVSRFRLNVHETGIITMSTPAQNENSFSSAGIGYQIQDVEAIFGKGKIGWHSTEQGLRSETYFDYGNGNGEGKDGAISIEFIYSDGEFNGLQNRLVWVSAEMRGSSSALVGDITAAEAQAMAAERYPETAKISHAGEETISYTDPPNYFSIFTFDVALADGKAERCGVSKDGGIFFTYYADANGEMVWGVSTGALEQSPENSRQMTLADVRGLAQKIGTRLTLNDLLEFIGEDIGSGLFVMQYEVEGGEYRLIVGAGDLEGRVDYARFGKVISGAIDENYIDMRYYDVDKYIADGTREMVSELSQMVGELSQVTPSAALPVGSAIGNELYDLTNGASLSVSAGNLSSYQFFTNSKKITVSIVSIPKGEYECTFTLFDAESNAEIQAFTLDNTNRSRAFTMLTAAKKYCIVASGIDDSVTVAITD